MKPLPDPLVILYVDPNAEMRAQRAAALQQHAVTVYDAADAQAAVGIAQQLKRLDVLVSEGYLGSEVTGFDLRDAVKQRFPDLRAVFTSRYDLTGYESFIDGSPVIYEPVSESQLVSEVLGYCELAAPVNLAVEEDAAVEVVAQAIAVVDDEDAQPPVLAPRTMLGSYQIQERLYAERDSETYLAVQQGVERKVALVLLRPELVGDPASLAKFQERERLKAAVEHPRIAPLYEAVQIGPHHFYTRELPHGRTIAELQDAGVRFGEKTLVDIIANVCDAMSYATQRGHHYRMLSPRDISIDVEHHASIVNVFRPATDKPRDHAADVKKFLMMLRSLADGSRARHLIDDLAREGHKWDGLCTRAAELQEQFRERSLLKRADTKEAQDIQAARESDKMPVWMYAMSAVVVLALIGGIIIRSMVTPPPPPLPLKEEMVPVAAGEFLYQKEPAKRTSPAFWINKYEVTIGQYAEFLDALQKDPAHAKAYDHPEQSLVAPEKTGHEPANWKPYLQAARTAGFFNNQPINVNCPVANVDWWDAHAYAKWKGHRLPTEEEWERAARGTDGRVFPWGNNARPDAANLGADYDAKGKGGKTDGFNYWAPVDRMPLDVSPEGVCGMAGNVEEWTSSQSAHPDIVDLFVPIVRGGHFGLPPSDNLLTRRLLAESATDAKLARGFRTVSDSPPAQEPK